MVVIESRAKNSTSAVRFLDTNVLLYAISTDPEDVSKAETAREILDQTDLGLSVQVLQEFYVQATRSNRSDALSHEQASSLVEAFARFPIQEIDLSLVRAALDTKDRYQISYWDAAIIEAARALGCETVLSEDLNNGQSFLGVVIHNPFES